MVQVFIQPSYGTPEARRHWSETLAKTVLFRSAGFAELLDPVDLARLNTVHQSGRARFWGATARHDKRMDSLATGDVVLLTGQKHVLAIGEVGHGFRAPAFARSLWHPDPAKCLWSNVYSLRRFWLAEMPYEEIWALPGFNAGDNFMGLRFLAPEKAEVVLAHTASVREVAAPA
ncbi:hypothetical protein [Lentzea flaviverrucosa]|uniref:Uncharacterized protein n=1 Tax=Lentzea flaviverrucosa TaxID=200379 RepID=A0A1H9XYC7_9PSEU|nr:hypothetical protein [Lentzea flaviverrucosa]RDI16373.1 hypothetical protein DFR72_1252 [Lentzea flaviverrucosa]SES51220.1 hypothetical protein SAMN05216195_12736 [Lentzea flaviverrucosa]